MSLLHFSIALSHYEHIFLFPISASTDSRYNFSVRNGNNPAGRYLTVKDPDFKDKGVYVCYANRTDSIITKVFRLRVRGKLANENVFEVSDRDNRTICSAFV